MKSDWKLLLLCAKLNPQITRNMFRTFQIKYSFLKNSPGNSQLRGKLPQRRQMFVRLTVSCERARTEPPFSHSISVLPIAACLERRARNVASFERQNHFLPQQQRRSSGQSESDCGSESLLLLLLLFFCSMIRFHFADCDCDCGFGGQLLTSLANYQER